MKLTILRPTKHIYPNYRSAHLFPIALCFHITLDMTFRIGLYHICSLLFYHLSLLTLRICFGTRDIIQGQEHERSTLNTDMLIPRSLIGIA